MNSCQKIDWSEFRVWFTRTSKTWRRQNQRKSRVHLTPKLFSILRAEIAQTLKLHKLRDRSYQIQPCSAKSGEGVREGLEWALKQVKPKK